LSLAIGRRGQNVRLASKLVGLDLEIMTADELAETLDRAERWFGQLPHASEEVVQALIGEGFLSYNDLSSVDGKTLTEFTSLTEEQGDEVIAYAEDYADTMEEAVQEEQRQAREAADAARREADEQARQEAEAAAANPPAEDVSENTNAVPVVHEPGTSTLTSPAHPLAYHEGPPTDTASVEHAVEQEELRTGEDGELTTPPPGQDEQEGATA
jgi:N utilization substance protein A